MLPTMKYATQKSRAYFLRVHLIPAFWRRYLRGGFPAADPGTAQFHLAAGLAWETAHHLQCALSKILGTAVEWGYIEANPVRTTKLPKRMRIRPKPVLTPIQLRLLLMRPPEPSRSLVFLLALTGIRIGELLALRWAWRSVQWPDSHRRDCLRWSLR